ncbi:MAG: hypothetical protein SFU99_23260 [Saprospiraceae bacterium]|nr:hypothetical protein [Saprospiraceae bacterium]
MKSLSLNQMSNIEGGQRLRNGYGYCGSALRITVAGYLLHSPLVFFFGLFAAAQFCGHGGHGGGDDSCASC